MLAIARPISIAPTLTGIAGIIWLGLAPVSTGYARDIPGDVEDFLESYCVKCHRGKRAKAKLDLTCFDSIESMIAAPKTWLDVISRVRSEEMPPEDEDAPTNEERAAFLDRLDVSLRKAACDDGVQPGPAITRRLNRAEYATTIRDLFGMHFDTAATLPADGAGGEGFDNAAETLTLSPVHLEKYIDAAGQALDYVLKDAEARERLIAARPDKKKTADRAAREVLEKFLPRAFRRPVESDEVDAYLALFREELKSGETFERSVAYALKGALVSPHFVFRIEEPAPPGELAELGHYEIASRLSYFLWGSMPDKDLLRLAESKKLHDPATLEKQVSRMLKSSRVRAFSRSFVEQWLGTRELGRGIKPDPTLSRQYDADLEAVMKYEPVLFFEEILRKNIPLTTLIDADFSYMNNELARHYRLRIGGLREHPKRVKLPANSRRGGVLGMAAVLAVSSYPHRTSPVLRGKWVLETLLGTPPPPPPPNVPELEEHGEKAEPATIRERLEKHRENPICATCHDRIDPIGFGLENYDVLGRWRDRDSGKAIDSRGRLPDGTTFDGPDGLKRILLDRKREFLEHLTTKMLGFALNRGLTLEDYCVVREIAEKVETDDFSSHRLVHEIVRSVPFLRKSGTRTTSEP